MKKEIRSLYGVLFTSLLKWSSFEEGMKLEPDVIVGMGTSSDWGPNYLCRNEEFVDKQSQQHLLAKYFRVGKELNIPVIASVGNGGSDSSLEWNLSVIDEMAKENNWHLRLAVISGEIQKNYLSKQIEKGTKIRRMYPVPRLSENLTIKDVDEASTIVAQMGPEPIIEALKQGVDGVVTGRALDTGLLMATPLKEGFPRGLTAFMAKSMEGGARSTVAREGVDSGLSPAADLIFGELHEDYCLIKPPNPELRCTVQSVVADTLYERTNPFHEAMPGGYLDLTDAQYKQHDEVTLKISGGKWVDEKYTVKLEAGKLIGYRTICITAIRDPIMIQNLDIFIEMVKKGIRDNFPELEGTYKLLFKIFGKDAVMGPFEPNKKITSHEVCVIIDAIAATQDKARLICTSARRLLFYMKDSRIKSTGHLAFPFVPIFHDLGPQYIWNIWHLMDLNKPTEPFKMRIIDFPRK